MNDNENRGNATTAENGQIANMSKLDFLMLLWEARVIGQDYVEANT